MCIKYGLLLVLAGMVLPAAASPKSSIEKGCQRETVASVLSPDDTWAAVTYEDACGEAPATTLVERVVIKRVRGNGTAGEVLTLATASTFERPSLQWLLPDVLLVFVAHGARIERTNIADVKVIVEKNTDIVKRRQDYLSNSSH